MSLDVNELYADNIECRKTHVTFRILSDMLDSKAVTNDLGLIPTRSFEKGEAYNTKNAGIRYRPTGHWSISSENSINSTSTEKHAAFILSLLECKTEIVEHYLQDPKYRVEIVFWWEANNEHGGFTMSKDVLLKLCSICNYFEYHFIG